MQSAHPSGALCSQRRQMSGSPGSAFPSHCLAARLQEDEGQVHLGQLCPSKRVAGEMGKGGVRATCTPVPTADPGRQALFPFPREAKVFGKMSYSYSFFRSLSYFCHVWTQFRETTNVKVLP